jgi:hypothetical protein
MQWLLFDGPFFASALPGKFAFHVWIEALKNWKAIGIIVVKPAGRIYPIQIMAGMHGAKLNVKIANNVRIAFARLEFLSGFYAVANGIDHAVPKVRRLIENDNFRMPIVIKEASGIRPRVAVIVLAGHHIHHEPAVRIDCLEKSLAEFVVAFRLFRIARHAGKIIKSYVLALRGAARGPSAERKKFLSLFRGLLSPATVCNVPSGLS